MTKKDPLISVLMPYYNNLKHVEAAIQSVFAQTYKNLELIVVDDASTDPEAKVLIRRLQQRYGFMLIEAEKNVGVTKTIQRGFEASHGDYISLCAHDDLYTTDKLET